MKSKLALATAFILSLSLFSFVPKDKIGNCFISFKGSTTLTAQVPDRLPETSEQVMHLETTKGDVEITRIDGYRILYNNDKKAPFVNLKVELSKANSYGNDTIGLIENLRYLNSVSQPMETKDLMELEFNGYKIYGLSRSSIERGNTLATFIMFPGNSITVYFYFNNIKPEYSNFSNLKDFKRQRDKFIDDYTRYLKECKEK